MDEESTMHERLGVLSLFIALGVAIAVICVFLVSIAGLAALTWMGAGIAWEWLSGMLP